MAGRAGGKTWFFDSAAVLKMVTAAERKVLSAQGAAVRRVAQKSLVYGDAPSAPGRPPTAHRTAFRRRVSKRTGKVRVSRVSPLREYLFFAFDPRTRSVVVGPARASGTSGTAPRTLEFGGTTPGRFPKPQAARPFMRPALATAKGRFAAMWKDTIRG